ncbi:MAG: sulfatase-like hydrolase/transferase [Nitrospirae bacterium]|nr:sulfatase-like hydrolase/transferase [Nitrospirota bacterium]
MSACRADPAEQVSVELPTTDPPEGAPRLVLLLVVDQFGAHDFDRLEPLFTAGIRTLLDRGVSFSQAYHDHALTETAPGHATLATGSFPRHHGIVSNRWIEEGHLVSQYAIDDDLYDESPLELEVTALGDWIKAIYPESRVFSASGKDRAAILMGGLGADGAFWYDEEIGGFKTSEFYTEPDWLDSFNEQNLLDERFGQSWEPLPLAPEIIEELQLQRLEFGPLVEELPLSFGPPRAAADEKFYSAVRDSPWWDEYLAQFARYLIEAEGVGADRTPDLLALSFSAADFVGHDHGPNSREYVDLLLRLDRTLGEFLDFIDERVGLENTIIGFSADHGVVPVPEVRHRLGLDGQRIGSETILCLQQVGPQLAEKHGMDRWMVPGPRLAPGLVERTGRTRADLEEETAELLEQCPAVATVWTGSELLLEVDESDHDRWLYANCYYPERSPDFLIQFEEYSMPSVGLVTTHGSPYDYDTHVPLVILAPGLAPETLDIPVRTVDLAPSLANLAGIPIPDEVDGWALIDPATPSP